MPKVIAIPPGQDELAQTLRKQGFSVQSIDQLRGPVDAILYDGGIDPNGSVGYDYDDLNQVDDQDLKTYKSTMLFDMGGRSPREVSRMLARKFGVD